MRLFLMAAGLAATAVIAACEKENNPQIVAHNPEQPLQPNGNFRTTFDIRHPEQEFQKLCRLLFNQSGEACNSISASQAMRQQPARNQGLNAYTRGILSGDTHYYFHEAQNNYVDQLNALEGVHYYLSGHAGCPSTNMNDPNRRNTCIKINDGREIPNVYDFVDDYSNLIGAFFFLKANRARFTPQSTCTIGVATLGSDESPFCASFTMHNIVLTPVALNLRGAQPNLVSASCRGN